MTPSLVEQSAALAAGQVSSVELTHAALAQASAWQPHINAFITIEAEEALASAKLADERRARGMALGPLDGLPMAHKDMFDRAGKVATGGSPILAERTATSDSTVVRRLAAAGAVWLGGLNMAEFAASPTGINVHYGAARNPWNPDYITGGSSSGSGAAVAAGIVGAALGSDTGGSIRLPASICGVTGLKPTYGRVSRAGVMPRATSLDTVGPLARSAMDHGGRGGAQPHCRDHPAYPAVQLSWRAGAFTPLRLRLGRAPCRPASNRAPLRRLHAARIWACPAAAQ